MSEYDLKDFLSDEELDSTPFEELIEEDERTRRELVDDARYSEGGEIFFDLKSLYTTLNMVNKNYNLLCKKRNEFVNRGAHYWMINDTEEFFREYLRRLHNYIASVHTLISHTYTFLDRYEDKAPELKSKYFTELRSRNLEVKVNLLKQIRHYTQKNWEPPLSASISPAMSEGEEDELKLLLDKEEMLEWNGWDAEVEPFLESFEDDIEITELAIEYQSEINDFYDWFRTLVLSVFFEEMKQFITADIILSRQIDQSGRGSTESE